MLDDDSLELIMKIIRLEGRHGLNNLRSMDQEVRTHSNDEVYRYFRMISQQRGHENLGVTTHGIGKVINGLTFLQDRKYQEAATSFVSAINSGRWVDWACDGLGRTLLMYGMLEEARTVFLHGIDVALRYNNIPRAAQCFGGLGNTFLKANLPNYAFEAFGVDLGMISPTHYYLGRLRNRRALAFSISAGARRGKEILRSNAMEAYVPLPKFAMKEVPEALQYMIVCSVIWDDRSFLEETQEGDFHGVRASSYLLRTKYFADWYFQSIDGDIAPPDMPDELKENWDFTTDFWANYLLDGSITEEKIFHTRLDNLQTLIPDFPSPSCFLSRWNSPILNPPQYIPDPNKDTSENIRDFLKFAFYHGAFS